MLRAATDHDPTATVLKVDGIGAYDHVFRSAMLVWLSRMRGARALLPCVRLPYATPSIYVWFDNQGERRTVTQAEGGEQGDPLMPLLFSIGIQGALEEVSTLLVAGEQLCAFLDDVKIVCQPGRVLFLYDGLDEPLLRVPCVCGTSPSCSLPMWRTWPDVWQPKMITVLGTPIGSEDCVREKMNRRVEEERRLGHNPRGARPAVCVLLQSANPRANHSLRTMSPSQSVEYARAHDEGIWQVVSTLLDLRERGEHDQARQVATLPMRQGGLGLRSASRGAEAAYWASRVDGLPMISERNPAVAEHVEHTMTQEVHHEGCLAELHNACGTLDREGFWWRPTWSELRHGKRPPESTSSEPGEWKHGWQFWASSVSDTHFRKNSVLPRCTATRQAHLRSHSGHNAGVELACAPTTPECRCRLSCSACFNSHSPIAEATCEGVVILWICLDATEPHAFRQAVSRSGPIERMVARIFPEAAQVRHNAYLRDVNIGVSSVDERRVEVLAQIFRVSGVHNSLWTSPWSARSAVQANHNRMPRKWTVLRWSEHGMSRKQPTLSWPHPSGAD